MPPTFASELPALLAFGGALLGLVALGEVLRRSLGLQPDTTRRLIHAGTGICCASIPFAFRSPDPVYLLAAIFAIGNFLGTTRGWPPAMHGVPRRSLGTSTFPLALIFALAATWSTEPTRAWIITPSFLILALADPMAAVAGSRAQRRNPAVEGAGKSFAGSAACFCTALAVGAASLFWLRASGVIFWSSAEVTSAALALAAVTAGAEFIGKRGWDNVLIVAAAVVFLVAYDENPLTRWELLGSVGLGMAFGLLAWRARLLDAGGSVAGALVAVSVAGLGGWAWAVPSFTFFFLSSLLSKLKSRAREKAEETYEKGSVRDAGQVYANGGIGWVLLLAYVVWESPWLYWAFLGSFAAAAADTWATEIGGLGAARPRLITTFRKVPAGTSGAVSVWGMLGALAGALVVWLAALPFPLEGVLELHSLAAAFGIAGGGFAASLVDSLIGATVQVQYVDGDTGTPTERPVTRGVPNAVLRGFPWIRNDLVNLVCTAAGAVLATLSYLFAAP